MSLIKSTYSGVKWTSATAVIQALVHLLRISILARFLDKSDFGIMAILLFVIGFLNLFMDMGTSSAILHKKDISEKEYSSLFWLNIIFSIVVYCFILVLGPFIEAFYKVDKLSVLLAVIGSGVIITALGRQSKVILQKELLFKSIGIIDSVSAIISLFISIIFAFFDFGIYSLIFGVLSQYVISSIAFFIVRFRKERISMYFSYEDVKPFLKIGIFQVGGQVLNFFSRDIDILLIGKLLGTEILGIYSLAKQLVNSPIQLINPILVKVASPIMAKIQDNIQLLRSSYLKLINVVSTVNFPIYFLILIFSPIIIRIFYGPGFEAAIFPVKILSIYMAIRSLGNPVSALVIATGRTDLEFYWNVFVLCTVPIAVYIGAQWGVDGVLYSLMLSRVVIFVPGWYILLWKTIQIPFADYCRSIIPNINNLMVFVKK